MQDGFKVDTDCDKCPNVKIMPENRLAWELVSEMDSGMFDLSGGINTDLIRFFFQVYEVDRSEERDVLKKVMIYIDEFKKFVKRKSR